MKVGVSKEIKTDEYRVGLTPGAVRDYVAAGQEVLVDTHAAAGIGSTDDDYSKAGATILDSAREVFASSEMIVKVKEPQTAEWVQLRENQFTYLHLATDPERAKGLLKSGCTAIAYETVTDNHGGLPLFARTSEIADRLAIEAAGTALQRYTGGRGLLIGGVPGVQPARIVVIGGGGVGTHAARMVVGLGAELPSLIARCRAYANSMNCSKVAFVPGSQQSTVSRKRCLQPMSSSALCVCWVRGRRSWSAVRC